MLSVTGVGKSCPKLHNLAFSNVSVYETPMQPCPDWFNNLEAMELWADPGAELNPNLVKQLLLFSPDLKNLLFNGCGVLTDKLLSEVWEVSRLYVLCTCAHTHTLVFSSSLSIANKKNILLTKSKQITNSQRNLEF